LKRIFRRLAAGAVVGAMLCTSAGAVTVTPVKLSVSQPYAYDEANEQYVITVSTGNGITITEGQQYVLMVAQGKWADSAYEIDPSTLTYIDQQAATSSGLTFYVKPGWTPDSVVLLGGNFGSSSSPIAIGYIDGKGTPIQVEIPVLDVSAGKDASDITFAWASSDGTPLGSANPQSDGTLKTQIEGTGLTITISRPGYLPLVIHNYSPGTDITQYISQFNKGAGDVDGDKAINMVDISTLINSYDKAQNYIKNADFNRDGVVNMVDLSALISSYNRNTADNMTFSAT